MTHGDIERFLSFEFDSSDLGKTTPRLYLHSLLSILWEEKEGFSGKRPFGNSCWEYDLARALIKSGVVDGVMDEDGCVDDVDMRKVNQCIRQVITHIFYAR